MKEDLLETPKVILWFLPKLFSILVNCYLKRYLEKISKMNICKSAGGGISARTKSLREKFSSKRSYSELSFAGTSTSTVSLTASDSSRAGSFRRPRSSRGSSSASNAPAAPLAITKSQRDAIARQELSRLTGGEYNSYMPEDAYSSALDVNCQLDGEPRFPWQRDVAIQCDLLDVPQILVDDHHSQGKSHSYTHLRSFGKFWESHSSKHHQQHPATTAPVSSSSFSTISEIPRASDTTNYIAHPASSHLLFPSNSHKEGSLSAGVSAQMLSSPLADFPGGSPSVSGMATVEEYLATSAPGTPGTSTPIPVKKFSHFAGLRFWKSTSPLNAGVEGGSQPPGAAHLPVLRKERKSSFRDGSKTKSVLQRAISFDSRSYSKLISNDSVQSLVDIKDDQHTKSAEGIIPDDDSSSHTTCSLRPQHPNDSLYPVEATGELLSPCLPKPDLNLTTDEGIAQSYLAIFPHHQHCILKTAQVGRHSVISFHFDHSVPNKFLVLDWEILKFKFNLW